MKITINETELRTILTEYLSKQVGNANPALIHITVDVDDYEGGHTEETRNIEVTYEF
jgi:hypothetical protein